MTDLCVCAIASGRERGQYLDLSTRSVDNNRSFKWSPFIPTNRVWFRSRYNYREPAEGNQDWLYAFNPCYDFTDKYCKNVIVSMKTRTCLLTLQYSKELQ